MRFGRGAAAKVTTEAARPSKARSSGRRKRTLRACRFPPNLASPEPAGGSDGPVRTQRASSKRSAFITLFQAATKSRTNLPSTPDSAYTSASARSCELDPKTRSTRVAVHFAALVSRSRNANVSSFGEVGRTTRPYPGGSRRSRS